MKSKKQKLSILYFLIMLLTPLEFIGQSILLSPDKLLELHFELVSGKPTYSLQFSNHVVVKASHLGFRLKDGSSLVDDFKVISQETHSRNEQWETVWGEERYIKNQHNELLIKLEQVSTKRLLDIRFRL
ncbi:MAG: alpha-glucosidase, partial [Flavobacteriaceae bacterium]|nr:alpha-glucosidase [Flavobacteriaceae bacterium]